MDAFGIDGEVSGRAHARAIMHAQRRVRGGFDGVQSPGDFFFRKTEARIAVPSRDTRLPLRFQSRVVSTEKVSEPTEFFGQIQRPLPATPKRRSRTDAGRGAGSFQLSNSRSPRAWPRRFPATRAGATSPSTGSGSTKSSQRNDSNVTVASPDPSASARPSVETSRPMRV